MRSDPSGYRRLYASLVRLYPKGYRERYGEGMEQTFSDLCREQIDGLSSAFLLTTFADTILGIFSQHLSSSIMSKTFVRPLIIALCILILPLIGELTVPDWNWGVGGFLVMGTLLYVTFLMIELIAKHSPNTFYKAAVGIAVLTTFAIIYVNLAVGIIGEGNNTSACYFLTVPVGFLGLALSRLKPKGLSWTAFAMAAVVLLVPTIALLLNDPYIQEEPGPLKVFVLSGCLAVAYAVAGALFRKAAKK